MATNVVHSTLKSKSKPFIHIDLSILHSLPFHQLSVHRLNKGSYLILEPEDLLPVSYQSYFLQYLDQLAVHSYYQYGG